MASPAAQTPPTFPDRESFALQLFAAAIRHLEDARVLHLASRFPGAIASSVKATEMAIKSVLVLDGAMGWWDKLFTSHSPLQDITNHQVLKQHHVLDALNQINPTLLGEVTRMERLSPGKPGAGHYRLTDEANPEYPFLSVARDIASGRLVSQVHSPTQYFSSDDSREFYNVACDLLTAVQTLHPAIVGSGVTIPGKL